jgi:tetratricopeptide (TPR) repeat protein
MVYVTYGTTDEELKGRDVEFLGRNLERDRNRLSQPEWSGTMFTTPVSPSRSPYWDLTALRDATPKARFGNLVVYQGTFRLPGLAAATLYYYGKEKLYADKPDAAAAEKMFQQSAGLDPNAFFVHIELGNLLLKRGAREQALQAYTNALKYSPEDRLIRQPIEEQIARIARNPPGEIPPIRNPGLE